MQDSSPMITVVGAGLAGSEAAWQIACAGLPVTLVEMRPVRQTAVHHTGDCAELVCSNSFRADKLDNAVGLLKEEMRRLGSLIMRVADACRVPAGAALAVDRERFARAVTTALEAQPLVTVARREVASIPPSSERQPVILATGPLTSDALAADIARLVGAEHLYFYDAISPIVLADTIDRSKVFRASRWGRSLRRGRSHVDTALEVPVDESDARTTCSLDDGQGDYLNCPLTREEYARFYEALTSAESATVHDFDRERFFEGCLPVEVMAHRGVDTLRFGPMKPVGLIDPRTGREPYAAVQLRQDNLAGDHFSLVGFQTQLKWGEQARVLRMIPGLEQAEFARYGMVHRNTYVNGPRVLAETWQVRTRPSLFLAGQMSGVEGYVESAASGLLAGLNAAALATGEHVSAPPRTTAIGALAFYVSHADPGHYDPTNITFGIIAEPGARPGAHSGAAPGELSGIRSGAPPERLPRGRLQRKVALAERALVALEEWAVGRGLIHQWESPAL